MLNNTNQPTSLIAFLKRHFFITKDAGYRHYIMISEEERRTQKKKARKAGLQAVINQHVEKNKEVIEQDIHFIKVHNWLKELDKDKFSRLPKREKRLKAKINNYEQVEKRRHQQEHHPSSSWGIKLGTSVAIALILAVAIGGWKPELADRVGWVGDNLFIIPLLNLIDPAEGLFVQAVEETEQKLDQDELIRYIVKNHHLYQADLSGRARVYKVDPRNQGGRVAGAIATANSVGEPTAGLYLLSLQVAPKENTIGKQIEKYIFLLGEKQKAWAKKINRKLLELVE